MGREWELSFRLGMRPWIAVAYSAPVAAASAVFLVYPIGQGSFSDGMPLGKVQFAPSNGNIVKRTLLNGESLSNLVLNPLSLLNHHGDWNVVCSAIRRTNQSSVPGNNEPEEKEEQTFFDPTLVEKGLKSLDNPVLRGSFSLVLANERLNFLDNIAKNAWKEITSRGLRTVTASSPQNLTIKLKTCLPNVVQTKRGGVYVIQNVETGMAVTGQTTNFDNRFNQYAARASRFTPTKGDNINKAYYKEAQEVKARTGNANLAFQRYIIYSWVNEAGESLDLENSRDLRNEMSYLEHRLILAFYECGLAYNTNDSAPQINDFVTLDDQFLTETEKEQLPVGGIKETKPFKVDGKAFLSMGDYWAFKDSLGQPRGNRKRLRDKLVNNSNDIESDTRYLTEGEIKYYEANNLFIITERSYSAHKPRPKQN
jgi:hypothetical protein